MAVCTGEEVTPGSAVPTISREQAMVCTILMLNKDPRFYSPKATWQKAELLFFKDDEGPIFGVLGFSSV